jgi:hypothetical protein
MGVQSYRDLVAWQAQTDEVGRLLSGIIRSMR